MTAVSFPPGLVLVFGALLIPAVRGAARTALVLGLPLVVLALVWLMPEGHSVPLTFLDYDLVPVHWTRTGRLLATVFAIMAMAGGLFALRQARTLELAAAFAYAGSAVGACFSGDLVTLFIFLELKTRVGTRARWPGAPSRGTTTCRRCAAYNTS